MTLLRRPTFLGLACFAFLPILMTDVSEAKESTAWDLRWEFQGDAGYELLRSKDNIAPTYDRFYLLPSAKLTLGAGEQLALRMAVRLRSDARFIQNDADKPLDFSPRALNVQWNTDYGQMTLGLQEVEWGEAFGFKVADVVHPYELSDYLLANTVEAKIPLALVDVLFIFGPVKLELIFSPFPRRSSIPESIQGIRTTGPEDEDEFLDKPEFGGRLGYTHSSGIDLKPFFYSHGNRLPLFGLGMSAAGPVMTAVQKRVQTFGLSASQATEKMVYRGDVTYTIDQPAGLVHANEIPLTNRLQAVFGADHSTESGDTNIGVQVQTDHWNEKPLGQDKRSLTWWAFRYQSKFFGGKWEPQAIFWHGIGNHDAWLQLNSNINFLSACVWSVGMDYVFKLDGDGSAFYFQQQTNVYSRVSYRF